MPDNTPGPLPDGEHPALQRVLDLLWASPELRPLPSPAGSRRRAADRLGHADLDTTTATYTTTRGEAE
ncbi:hypothetical protein [Kitasatospora sp. NPDC092286]|uniref:hypothetical protein n=1 Tax=Kitasatospora sp. NPDC092286 TaxID=3364087 RepID=UPI00380D5307